MTVPLTPTEWGTQPLPAEGERNTRPPPPPFPAPREPGSGAGRSHPVKKAPCPQPPGAEGKGWENGQLLPGACHPSCWMSWVPGPHRVRAMDTLRRSCGALASDSCLGTPTTCALQGQGRGPAGEERRARPGEEGLRGGTAEVTQRLLPAGHPVPGETCRTGWHQRPLYCCRPPEGAGERAHEILPGQLWAGSVARDILASASLLNSPTPLLHSLPA